MLPQTKLFNLVSASQVLLLHNKHPHLLVSSHTQTTSPLCPKCPGHISRGCLFIHSHRDPGQWSCHSAHVCSSHAEPLRVPAPGAHHFLFSLARAGHMASLCFHGWGWGEEKWSPPCAWTEKDPVCRESGAAAPAHVCLGCWPVLSLSFRVWRGRNHE